jgi:hypothetical protein
MATMPSDSGFDTYTRDGTVVCFDERYVSGVVRCNGTEYAFHITAFNSSPGRRPIPDEDVELIFSGTDDELVIVRALRSNQSDRLTT